MSSHMAPHLRYPHVFAIVRIDPIDRAVDLENSIAVVSVYGIREDAEREAARLNSSNIELGPRYVVFVSRFKSEALPLRRVGGADGLQSG